MREAQIKRKTAETDITCLINIDGQGMCKIDTGIGFFDHLLYALGKHGLIDISLKIIGDLHVDGHHSAEDAGIVLGQAVAAALGDKSGIQRVGSCFMPMDEALAFCALDISGRPYLKCDMAPMAPMVGTLDTQLAKEFFRAFAISSGITLHLNIQGDNAHHMLEAAFKALGRALCEAVGQNPRVKGIPSTKGVL